MKGTPITEEDIKKEEQEEEAYINSTPPVDVPVAQSKVSVEEASSISVAERNMLIKAQAKVLSKKSNVKELNIPHNVPGTDRACKNPIIVSEALKAGGSMVFCSSCGAQLKDPDDVH